MVENIRLRRITFVTANLGSGGAERVISLLANEFCKKGHDVEIIFFRDRLIFYELDSRIKIVVIGEECHSNAMWRKMLWLRKYVKESKPDVVIPFRVSVYTTVLFSLLGVSIPVISSERIDPHIPDPFWNMLRKSLLPFTTHLVVQTNYIKSYYPRFIQKKTSVIYNPVREEVFSLPRTSSLTPNPSPKCEGSIKSEERLNRIISVARLDPQKNQKMMIRAFAKIADYFPDWQLVIFGEGPLRSSLELIVKSLQLEGRVLLPGSTEHVIDELRKSKIFCFSSDYEGLSNSMIEALCVGLPIVTTNVSGTEDIIVDGENGFVVPINDEDAMVHSLRVLMADEQLVMEMGERNRQKAHIFSIDGIYTQWEEIIQSVVRDDN